MAFYIYIVNIYWLRTEATLLLDNFKETSIDDGKSL